MRALKFAVIFTSVLILIVGYMGARLAEDAVQWWTLAVLGALVWQLPIFQWASEADEFPAWRIRLTQASFVSMGLLSWILVITVLRDLALLATRLAGGTDAYASLTARTGGAPAFGAAAALSILGAWRTFRRPRLREVTVPVDGLPDALEGLRIAQITDLHVGPTIGRDYVERLVAEVRAAKPDLTALTGDIVDGNFADLARDVEPLAGLEPRGRVFYVPGNHEYYWDFERLWQPALQRLGAETLINRGVAVDRRGARFWIGGITDPAATGAGAAAPDVARAMDGGESLPLRILLSHRPDPAEAAARAGFQLQLSGHTHGGQFFPWTLIGKRFHRFYLGLMRHEGMWIYVSPGTGTWGPPVRVGTTPELTLLRLVRAG